MKRLPDKASHEQRALWNICSMLGPFPKLKGGFAACGNNCSGCQYEMEEAFREAVGGLGFDPYMEADDGDTPEQNGRYLRLR